MLFFVSLIRMHGTFIRESKKVEAKCTPLRPLVSGEESMFCPLHVWVIVASFMCQNYLEDSLGFTRCDKTDLENCCSDIFRLLVRCICLS